MRLGIGRRRRGGVVEARLRRGDLGVEARELGSLRVGRQRELRAPRAYAAIGNESCLLDVGEERLHRVEVPREERIEFVVVAFGAAERAAEPHGAQRAHAIGAVLREVLLGLKAAFGRRAIQPVVRRRDALLGRRVRQQVAGDLLARELIERLVASKRPQHVIAIRPRGNRVVAVESGGIRVADAIEPVHRALLGVVRRGQKPVDGSFVRVGRRVGDERAHLVGCRQQAGQIERHAAEQRPFVGLMRRSESLAPQAILNEEIDRIPDAPGLDGGSQRRTLHRLIRPMSLVDRPFGDPPADRVLLRVGQILVRVLGRHHVGAGCENALDDLALVRIAGNDRQASRASGPGGLFADVEAHLRFPRVPVGPVAAEAGIRHDRPHVAIEAHGGGTTAADDNGDNPTHHGAIIRAMIRAGILLVFALQAAPSQKVDIVSVAGCLKETRPGTWMVVNATDPVPSIANAPPKDRCELVEAPPGEFSAELLGDAIRSAAAHTAAPIPRPGEANSEGSTQ